MLKAMYVGRDEAEVRAKNNIPADVALVKMKMYWIHGSLLRFGHSQL
jgi:hypothetical protein